FLISFTNWPLLQTVSFSASPTHLLEKTHQQTASASSRFLKTEDDLFDFESDILLTTSSDVELVELPTRIGILPFRNKVLLPGAIIQIQCTFPSSIKLVEEELWQRKEKGLIGILLVI
ncbi:hypothetical protein M8C21_026169, partial [Ambrosia artemisiifolia]